jgi:hypothetical protein
MFLLNAFSVNMLAGDASVRFTEITEYEAYMCLAEGFTSAVGHADTAALFSSVLGLEVKSARLTVVFTQEDVAILGQYSGPRLPEGSTKLPQGATIRWYFVHVTH